MDRAKIAKLLLIAGVLLVVFGPTNDGKTLGIGEAAIKSYRLQPSDIEWYLTSFSALAGYGLIAAGVVLHLKK